MTATGLNLLVMGGIELSVDGDKVEVPEAVSYKGVMLGGVPNFAFTFGYTNSSWTLRADLVSQYVCRLLEYMDSGGYRQCMPTNRDGSITTEPAGNSISANCGCLVATAYTAGLASFRSPSSTGS